VKRLLYIIPTNASFPAGNVSRYLQIIDILKNHFEVSIINLSENSNLLLKDDPNLKFITNNLSWYLIKILYKLDYKISRLLFVLFKSPFKFLLTSFFGSRIIETALLTRSFDLIYTNYCWTNILFKRIQNVNLICDIHDIFAERSSIIHGDPWVTITKTDEIKFLSLAKLVISISEKEFNLLKHKYQLEHIHFFPYIKSKEQNGNPNLTPTNKFVYLASDNQVNREALYNMLTGESLRLLQDCRAEITVYGSICNYLKKVELNLSGISITNGGHLNKLDDLQNYTYGINLPGKSTGLKIKSIDYLNYGLILIGNENSIEDWMYKAYPNQIINLKNLFISPENRITDRLEHHSNRPPNNMYLEGLTKQFYKKILLQCSK
jgi:hypothetical protein